MPVTTITSTRNGKSAIRYVKNGKPHNATDVVTSRVVASAGVGCDPDTIATQMGQLWDKKGTKTKNQIELQRLTWSFSKNELNYTNKNDIYKCLDVSKKLAMELFPNHQVGVFVQIDGKRHMVHSHILINNIDFIDMKSLRGNKTTSHQRIAEVADKIAVSNGIVLDPVLSPAKSKRQPKKRYTHTSYNSTNRTRKNGEKYSYMNIITEAIDNVKNNPKCQSMDDFVKLLKTEGVNARPRNRTKNRKKIADEYSGISFDTMITKNDGTTVKKIVRGKRLGTNYQVSALMQTFIDNQAKAKSIKKKPVIDSQPEPLVVSHHNKQLAKTPQLKPSAEPQKTVVNSFVLDNQRLIAQRKLIIIMNKIRQDRLKLQRLKERRKYQYNSSLLTFENDSKDSFAIKFVKFIRAAFIDFKIAIGSQKYEHKTPTKNDELER